MNDGTLVRVFDLARGLRIVELNRPEKRNALSTELLASLVEALESSTLEGGIRVMILRGAGPIFCAGLDLQEAQDNTKAARSAELIARSLSLLAGTSAVTVAAVHGSAVAGGAGLMSACDFVLAAEATSIGYPEIHRGLVAGLVMTFLRRQLRERDVRELLLLGEIISASRAKEIGLINEVVPADQLEARSMDLACRLMAGAPEAVARTKRMIGELWHRGVDEDLHWAHEHHLSARGSKEAEEGMRAFFEKRKPTW
ncbi:enoyl-CoA hydratase/isomerase family protein [bacterium]|nr:enoyl-CoA hydratase/isomerase family protein [bacterium]